MPLGVHISIAGGVSEAPRRGHEIGCDAVQIFTKNNLRWYAKKLTSSEINHFKFNCRKFHIRSVVAHDCYLINLASTDSGNYKKSLNALHLDITRSELLGIPYLVMHPGAHKGNGEEESIRRIADSINTLHSEIKNCKVKLLLETTAGQGTTVGYRFEHLAEIIDLIVERGRVGVCVDTCHIFAAGYDIRTESGYQKTFEEFDDVIGLKRLKVFHLNDSKYKLDSRRDRHEHIGRGYIGLTGFKCIMKDSRFKSVPKLLETPKGERNGEEWDKINLSTLRRLEAE